MNIMKISISVFTIGAMLAVLACGAFASPRRRGGPSSGTTTTGISGDPNAGLEQVNNYLAGQGYQMVGNAVRNSSMPSGSFLAYPMMVQAGQCYTAVAVATGGTNLDMVLINPGGRTVQYNVDPDHHPWLSFCAERSGRYSARLSMARGSSGEYLYALYQGRRVADLGPLAGGQAPTNTNNGGPTSPTSAAMERQFAVTNSDMQARGYEPFGEGHRGELSQGQTRDLLLNLEGGKCYALLAVGDESVQDLDVILLAGNGRPVDRDVEVNRQPIVRVCPEQSGSFTMQISMAEGRGHFAYAAYRWPRGTRGAFGLAGLIYVRLMEVTQLLQVEGYAPDENFMPERGQINREGQSATHTVELPAGSCYAVLVVGGDGVVNLDVALLQGNTPLASDDSLNAFPDVRHCVQNGGAHTVAIRATGGSGSYFYQIFKRQQ